VEKKIWLPNLQGKVVSAPPGTGVHSLRQSKRSIFEEIGEIWTVGEVI